MLVEFILMTIIFICFWLGDNKRFKYPTLIIAIVAFGVLSIYDNYYNPRCPKIEIPSPTKIDKNVW